jgi:YD repeat-containing protein
MKKNMTNRAAFILNFIVLSLRSAVLHQFVALTLLIALLVPVTLFNPIWKTSAQKRSSLPQPVAPVSAPAQAIVFPDNNSNILFNFVSTLKSSSESISDFFTPPQLAEGFGMAKPVSPFSAFASSAIAVFFGFAAKKAESVPTLNPAAVPLPAGTVRFDFDADGKADFAGWRGSSGGWSVKKSSDSSTVTYTLGSGSSKIAPADYDNDSKADYAVFNPATGGWTIRKSSTNTDQTLSGFGQSGDQPVVGDYDGDSKADPALWRSSNGTWYVAQSSNSYTVVSTQFGQSGDIPVQGDYDGDGALDRAVYRPGDGYWYVLGTTSGFYGFHWGLSADIPVPADYDGDNKTDLAVYRGSTGTWYVYKSSGTGQYIAQTWGNYGDQPVPADYDGDGVADLAVWRPTSGNWYVYKSCNYYGAGCASNNNYQYAQVGMNGDIPAPASYLKQIGSFVQSYEMAQTRLSPKNETGGTNLYSRNFSWETSLAGLPGRAGLNAGFGISYNSLVWTKHGNSVYFDTDSSNISPGFRFGFPVIEPVYYDDNGARTFNYIMVSPSGARLEFRQVSGASDTYETSDSSYVQMKTTGAIHPNDPAENITITVTGSNGTKMSYEWKAGAFRCKEIKDSNGNYITVSHDDYGLLRTVTDTLGRIITVNYDSEFYPTSITQTWKDNNGQDSNITHTWATFTYTTQEITTNFSSPAITNNYGPPNGTILKVLQKVTFPTETNLSGTHTVFTYNTWGQVTKITNYSANNTELNYVRVNLPANASNPEPDCPRFTETYSKAANFNNNQEALLKNTFTENATYTLPDNTQSTGTMIEVKRPNSDGVADKLVSKIYTASSGWAESLPVLTEDWADEGTGLIKKRWTWSNWTQDNTSLSYVLNPRVTEMKTGDGTNTKRTGIEYLMQTGSNSVTQYGLVSAIKTYAANQSSILKTQTTSYNLSSYYVSRRIIGLLSESKLFEGDSSTGTLAAKITYEYDENGYSGTGQSVSNAVRHDGANYGTSFNYRGNPTSTKRWDVTSQTNDTLAVASSVKYNITGSPISQTDPRGRVSTLSYADVWNDSITRSTYAFPTTVTDSGGYNTTIKYRYDTGAIVWVRSPTPSGSGNTYGMTTSKTYDDVSGRLIKGKIDNTGAYTRYAYPTDGLSLNIYTTVIDANADNTINGSDEVLTETLLDGAGRMRMTRTENPNSVGGYTGKMVEYDVLGQLKRETPPTEINSSWNPANDDYRGMTGNNYIWLWNSREYDWKGRVTKETNTDATDRLYSYDGCGCAGGQVMTIKGEITTAKDVAGSLQTTKRRTQKIYEDILGRTVKSELWDLDGAGTAPYSTIANTYNARDQITSTIEYAGSDTSTTHQDTTMSYDGHGRLSTRHLPEEDNNTSTSWTYKPDDTVATVTDPRGAVTTYQYGHVDDANSTEYRAMLTNVSYSVPQNSNITVPATVTFGYDAAGNRTSMQEGIGGTGSMSYSYDELSRLKIEAKTFADTLASAPSGGYKLTYTYHLTGGLKSIEDPFGAVITYSSDKIGRTTAVGGSGFYDDFADSEITSYVSSISYRAFGGVKSMTLATASSTQVSLSYNSRLKPLSYQSYSSANTDYIQHNTYTYNNDGSIKEVENAVDSKFNQSFDYDFAGRLKRNEFGGTVGVDMPYKQTISYDAFDNITNRSTRSYRYAEQNFTAGYTNNRKTSGGYNSGTDSFDAAGNVVQTLANFNEVQKWKIDAAGRSSEWEETAPYVGSLKDEGAITTFDGDGQSVKRLIRKRNRQNNNTTWYEEPEYAIYSSATGQKISSLTSSGQKLLTFVYLGSAIIAEQNYGGNDNSQVVFKHNDPVLGNVMQTYLSGEVSPGGAGRIDFEALGGVVPPEEGEELAIPDRKKGGHISNPESGCQLDGTPIKCSILSSVLRSFNVDSVIDLSRNTISFSLQKQTKLVSPGHWKKIKKTHPTINDGIIRVYTEEEWVPARVATTYSLQIGTNLFRPQPVLTETVIDTIKKDFYKQHGKIYNECLKEVFGKDAPVEQTLENSPLTVQSTNQRMKDITGNQKAKVIAGTITPPNKKDPDGAVHILADFVNNYGLVDKIEIEGDKYDVVTQTMMTYAHETANLLDARKNPKGKKVNGTERKPGYVYGDPNDAHDKDTGQAVEKCMIRKIAEQKPK